MYYLISISFPSLLVQKHHNYIDNQKMMNVMSVYMT